MFIDCSYLPNLVDTRSVLILLRKFQSFYINSANKKFANELNSTDVEIRQKAKQSVTQYWQEYMQDIFDGLANNGFDISFEGEKILVKRK